MNTIITVLAIGLTLAAIVGPLWFAYRTRCLGFVCLSGALFVHTVFKPFLNDRVLAALPPPTQISLGEQNVLVFFAWYAASLGLFCIGAASIYRHIVRNPHAG